MDKVEARTILEAELKKYHGKPYLMLARLITNADEYEVSGPSGANYHVEISASWEEQHFGNIRVVGFIDDGTWRANFPLSSYFIKTSSDKIVASVIS